MSSCWLELDVLELCGFDSTVEPISIISLDKVHVSMVDDAAIWAVPAATGWEGAAFHLVVGNRDPVFVVPSTLTDNLPSDTTTITTWIEFGDGERIRVAISLSTPIAYKAVIEEDGRVSISFPKHIESIEPLVPPPHHSHATLPIAEENIAADFVVVEDNEVEASKPPLLRILVFIVGTQGDVQPFIPLCQRLRDYGHTVRIATHSVFKDYVQSNGLEFAEIAGDPKALIAYMIKTGGALFPSSASELAKDVPENRAFIGKLLESSWIAARQFRPDALIANPVSFAHIHIAEAMCIPLHMFFTMPYSPTRVFPHPLANLPFNSDPNYKNYLSYSIVDSITWMGLADLHNEWRRKYLNLESIYFGEVGSDLLHHYGVPYAYMWSPTLIPKPFDWGGHIDIVGFSFLKGSGMGKWDPPVELCEFLFNESDHVLPVIFVGFGSCVVADPISFTHMLYDAAEECKDFAKIIIQEGWSKLGGLEDRKPPSNVIVIGSAPHDWLFQYCRGVCHHGGAGTTAAGLRAGIPTMIIPFFGDQPFWGQMVANAGAGPNPIPYTKLSVEGLVLGFQKLCDPSTLQRAKLLERGISQEKGDVAGMEAFHYHLPVSQMICDVEGSDALARVFCADCHMKLGYRADLAIHDMSETRRKHRRYVYKFMDWSRSKRENENPGITIGSGLSGLVDEATGVVTALITEPYRGAVEKGVVGLGKGLVYGVGKSVGAGVRAGVVLVDKMGQGVGNFVGDWQDPEQYPARQEIRHFGDGLRVGGEEFVIGIASGLSGLVMHPLKAYETGSNIAVGVVKGVIGVISKPTSGALKFLSTTAKGIVRTPVYLRNPGNFEEKRPASYITAEEADELVRKYELALEKKLK